MEFPLDESWSDGKFMDLWLGSIIWGYGTGLLVSLGELYFGFGNRNCGRNLLERLYIHCTIFNCVGGQFDIGTFNCCEGLQGFWNKMSLQT